jgi:hypothetical protein
MVEENRLLVEYFPKIGPISGICYKLFSKRGKILLKKIFEYKNGIIKFSYSITINLWIIYVDRTN